MSFSSRSARLTSLIVALVIVAFFFFNRFSQWRTTHTLWDCMRGKGCEGVVVMNGSKTLSSAQLDTIMRSSAITNAVKQVEHFDRKEVSGEVIYSLTVNSLNGKEGVFLPVLISPRGDIFELRALILAILKAEAYTRLPRSRTIKDLYDELATLVQPMVPDLNRAGIETVKMGNQLYATDQLSAIFAEIGRNNASKPVVVIRP